MRKVLVPISTLSRAQMQSALTDVISLYRQGPVQVHLLSIQIPVSRHVSDFFGSSELRAIHLESGMEELAPAKAALDAAGVPYTAHVHVGRSADTIVRVVREVGCDRIVMGQAEQAGFSEKLFGTLANQVRNLLSAIGDGKVIVS